MRSSECLKWVTLNLPTFDGHLVKGTQPLANQSVKGRFWPH